MLVIFKMELLLLALTSMLVELTLNGSITAYVLLIWFIVLLSELA